MLDCLHMLNIDVKVFVGAGLGLTAIGIVIIAWAESAWLWGARCLALGIASLTCEWFEIFAKVCAITAGALFLRGLIFQRGWLS